MQKPKWLKKMSQYLSKDKNMTKNTYKNHQQDENGTTKRKRHSGYLGSTRFTREAPDQ